MRIYAKKNFFLFYFVKLKQENFLLKNGDLNQTVFLNSKNFCYAFSL